MQTSREVIGALLRGSPARRVGLHDIPWWDTLRAWVRQGYPTREPSESEEGPQPVDVVDHFGFDMACVGGWFDIMPLRGHSELVEETEEWEVRRNGAGAALKHWKDKSGTPEHVDFRMTSRKVWDRDYRPHLLELDRERVDVDGARESLKRRREQGLWTFYGHMFIWESMRQSLGDICLYESLLLDPGWIHDYARVYTDFFRMHYDLLFEEAGVPDGIWMCEDLGYRNGLFCSPKVLAELIFPYYQEMVAYFHARGLPVVFHTCGSVAEALDLIVDVGFDALHPMEVKAGNDALAFAEHYGDRLALAGGLDVRILESGDRDLIRREVAALIEGMKERGARYVFGSDHSLSTNVAYEDFAFAVEVYREHAAY